MITLTTLVKKVSALAGRVTKVAGKLDSLTRLFGNLDESLRNHVELWETISHSNADVLVATQRRVEELGKASENLLLCNGDLNTRMDKLQGEVGGLENIRGSLNSRVTNVEGELDELRGGGEGGGGGSEMNLRDRMDTLEVGLSRLEKIQYEDNESRVSGISEAKSCLEAMERDIKQLFGKNSKSKERFEELLGRHNALDSRFCTRNNDHIVEHQDLDGFYSDRDGNHIRKFAEHSLRLEVVERQLKLPAEVPDAPFDGNAQTAFQHLDAVDRHLDAVDRHLVKMEGRDRSLHKDVFFLQHHVGCARDGLFDREGPRPDIAGSLSFLKNVDHLLEDIFRVSANQQIDGKLKKARGHIKWIRMALGEDA